MKMNENSTICAIATSLHPQAISIIRVSGDDAISIVNKIFKGPSLEKASSHTIKYGYIVDFESKEIIDEVLVSVFRAPKTYTKEDVVEVNCHGGTYITQKVLEQIVKQGAKIATAGEFTKRAFLNGRIDLTKAEGIMELIESENEMARKSSINSVRGDVKKLIDELRDEIVYIIANIQVNIDYPEYDDVDVLTNETILPSIKKFKDRLVILLNKSKNAKIIKSGITTAIVGKPNVGKSSLLNALLREDKAIVTNIPGTTRDVVEAKIRLGYVTLNLIDTAGIRKSEDIVEQIGIEKSKKMIEEAEFILHIIDSSIELDEEDFKIKEAIKDKKHLTIVNKIDLESKIDLSGFKDALFITTKNENSIELLEQKLEEILINKDTLEDTGVCFNTNRQIGLLEDAIKEINESLKLIDDGIYIDFVELHLQAAWRSLGEITGEVYTEDLLDSLFSKFCLGK